MTNFLYPLVFYIILSVIYLYSTGRIKNKSDVEYKKWVETKGKKVTKAIIIIGIIYTFLFVLQTFF